MSRNTPTPLHQPPRYWALAACLLLVLVELLVHRHPYFAAEKIPGLFGLIGLAGFVLTALGARWLGRARRAEESDHD